MIMNYTALDSDNIEDVYNLFRRNKVVSLIPFESFRRGTINDTNFDPKLTLMVESKDKQEIIAAFIAIIRTEISGKICYLKACLVDKRSQRKGIGSQLLNELISRAQMNGAKFISYGDSTPNYWQPGLDLRHTSLYFFLKKHKFRTLKMRQNLTVNLERLELTPKNQYNQYSFERINKNEFQNLFQFVKSNFPEGTWAEEVALSFECDPPTSFVAKDLQNNIIGWASHSQLFPGSFGPTGVLQILRGKGIGTELLKWALWDMKKNGIREATIMWVVGDTVKYYSKAVGAFIFPIFIPMRKKLS
jgi:GNAT superfamily N-acetyltransferase